MIKRIMVGFDLGICAFSKGETGGSQKIIFGQGQNQKQMVQSPGTTGPNVCQSRFYFNRSFLIRLVMMMD